jgi:hypothetical protein
MEFIPTIVKVTATGALGAAGNGAELGQALYVVAALKSPVAAAQIVLRRLFQSGYEPQRFHKLLVLLRRTDCNPEFVPQNSPRPTAHINALPHKRSIERFRTVP